MDLLGGYGSDSDSDSGDEKEATLAQPVASTKAGGGSVNSQSTRSKITGGNTGLERQECKKVDVTTRAKLKLLQKYEMEFGSLQPSPAADGDSRKDKNRAPLEEAERHPSVTVSIETENDWKEAFDPKTGKPYYYHIRTGQTSWTKPGTQTAVAAPIAGASSTGSDSSSSKKRPFSAIGSANLAARQPSGRHLERMLNRKGNLDDIRGMEVINQSEVLDAVQAAEQKDIKAVDAPRIKTQMWSVEQGSFVTSSIASRTSKNKNSIQALASQAIIAQNALGGNNRKTGKSLRQSRAKYGW